MSEYSRYSILNGRSREKHGTRSAIVIAAIIVSAAIHVALMLSVRDMNLQSYIAEARNAKFADEPPNRVQVHKFEPHEAFANPELGDPQSSSYGMTEETIAQLARPPDPALTAPPTIGEPEIASGVLEEVEPPTLPPINDGWQPRQEIVEIFERRALTSLPQLPRREIVAVERVAQAPDLLPPQDLVAHSVAQPPTFTEPKSQAAEKAPDVSPTQIEVPAEVPIAPDAVTDLNTMISRFGEKPGEVGDYEAIDARLMAKFEVFSPPNDARSYFHLSIARRSAEELPVSPKDIIFVQDASRSLAEARLYFCRNALKEAIRTLAPNDRFNVVSFRDNAKFCFPAWTSPSDGAFMQADEFISALRSEGETDVFACLSTLVKIPVDPKRPTIIVLITDGRPTMGLTESSRIIGEFTKANENISLFALGTSASANQYLLDLLTFCNRGGATVVRSGRWDIGARIKDLVAGISSPVLGGLRVSTDVTSAAELFPLPSANLYAGSTLEYYGSCEAASTNLVVHVRGEGGENKSDVLFQFNPRSAERGDAKILGEWARRKMHSLIGAYARTGDPKLLGEITALSLRTGLPVPYRNEL